MTKKMIPVAASNRHAHLTQAHIEQLFGEGYRLTYLKDIKQPDEFVSGETIDVFGPKGGLLKVRILGPARESSQVEMSVTNARSIGVPPNIRLSRNLAGTAGVKLSGPCGDVYLEEGVIIPLRHIHANPEEACQLGLSEGQIVSIATTGIRSTIFHHVVVRIDPLFSLEFHLDTDEFNAAGLQKGDIAELIL